MGYEDIGEKGFLAYLNDDDRKVEGYFQILNLTDNAITIRTSGQIIIIPINRILKIKLKEGSKWLA